MLGFGGMMGGYGAGSSGMLVAGLFGWLWAIIWTVNSILITLVLIKLYERLSNGKKK